MTIKLNIIIVIQFPNEVHIEKYIFTPISMIIHDNYNMIIINYITYHTV